MVYWYFQYTNNGLKPHDKITRNYNNAMPKGIAFEGGGVAGVGHTGALLELSDRGLYKDLWAFAGSSAGSMIAGLCSCGMKPNEIHDTVFDMDFARLRDGSWFWTGGLYRLFNSYGWYKGDEVEKMYGEILETYTGNADITYAQAHEKYGTTLITTSTDVVNKKTIYRTYENSPDLPIKIGVRESCSIPVFYEPVCREGEMYVDGGVLDNYPIRKLYEYMPESDVVGCKFVNSDTCLSFKTELAPPSSVFEYIAVILRMLHEQGIKLHVKKTDWEKTMIIDIGDISSVDFSLSDESKKVLVENGRKACIAFYKQSTYTCLSGDNSVGVSP